jgi:hypothetical protein
LEQKEIAVLEEHLPYELDMLEESLIAWSLLQGSQDDKNKQDWLRRMSVIEAFWVHARVLQEFFAKESAGRAAVADDFTRPETVHYNVPDVSKIQNCVVHLNYDRPRGDDPAKLTYWEAQRVKESFDRAVVLFESKLSDDAKRYWRKREPQRVNFSFVPRTTHSSHHASILIAPGQSWSKQDSDD